MRLALAHQETDRIPVSMICSFINPPARATLEAYLQRERGMGVDAYLQDIVDTRAIGPRYIGPALPDGLDFWGVHRTPVQSGVEVYSEIDHYPLANIRDISDLDRHPWPIDGLVRLHRGHGADCRQPRTGGLLPLVVRPGQPLRIKLVHARL